MKKLIQILEKRLHLKLSKEQLQILAYDLHTPVLVNACAGSGKTMLLVLKMLILVISHHYSAQQILGITFSKRAQVDMQNRYQKALLSYDVLGGGLPHPYFATFHALFYRLLRRVNLAQGNRVLTSYLPISNYLERFMPYKSDLISDDDLLQSLFQTRDQMINLGLTFDGLTIRSDVNQGEIREGTKRPKLFLKYSEPQNDHDKQVTADYRMVVSAYNRYKLIHHLIDFSDMMIVLYKAVTKNKDYRLQIQKIMQRFKVVFIDEFQDISQLQWQLMQEILSPYAKNHLVVIGDDDQSIYSFRGSDPRIIMQYKHNYPQTKVFNLSTNYRTGGNILKPVVNLITSNHYRLPKKLLSGNTGQGKLIEYLSNDRRFSANEVMLHKLLKDLKNPEINDNNVAILVRYNTSRMFIIDWLASHHCYVRAGQKSFILQNNYLYRTFISLAKGLIKNRVSYIYPYATKIVFAPYRKHMYNIIKQGGLGHQTTVSQYAQVARAYDGTKRSHLTHADKVLGRYSKKLQHPTKMYQNYLGSLLWLAVDVLTRQYFKYMLKNNYIDKDFLATIKHYLSNKFSHLANRQQINEFFKNEDKKRQLLMGQRHQNSSLHILSLHQAKGLQFKYVYLYDLDNRQDTTEQIAINHYFKPNMSLIGFLTFLLNVSPKRLKTIEKQIYGDTQPHALQKLVKRIMEFEKQNYESHAELIGKIMNLKLHNTTSQAAIEEQAWQLYHNYLHISQTIEEERRLIYVGVTRARKRLYLAYNRNANPLLNELQINHANRFYLEPNGKVMNTNENHTYQKHLANLRKKLLS